MFMAVMWSLNDWNLDISLDQTRRHNADRELMRVVPHSGLKECGGSRILGLWLFNIRNIRKEQL